jgi:trigger factor
LLGITKEVAETTTAKVQFTVKNISRLSGADVNQELFDKIYGEGKVSGEAEFKTKVKEELAAMFVNDSEQRFFNDVVEYLLNKVKFELPNDFLKRWIVAVNEKPVTPEQVDNEYEGYSKGLKWSLIENKIIKDNDIKVSNEEVIESTKALILDQFAKYSPMPMQEEELNQTVQRVLANQEEAKKIYEKIYGDKVRALFKTKFTVENTELAYDDFYKSWK